MEKIILTYDANDTLALSILEIIKRTNAFTIMSSDIKKKRPLQISLQQARSGKVNNYESVNDFFRKISQDVKYKRQNNLKRMLYEVKSEG